MERIFKYPLEVKDMQELFIPGDTILSVAEQNGGIVVYAMTNEILKPISYQFRIIGTGHPVDPDIEPYVFLGTVKLYEGQLMFHVFYKQK